MIKLPDFTPMLHRQAKDGYRASSVEMLVRLVACLKAGGDFTLSERSYLLECLENTLAFKPEDANKGFYLSYPRGKKKTDTVMRDFRAAMSMYHLKNSEIPYGDRLRMVADEINRDFPMFIIDVKTVEKACADYRNEVLNYLYPEDEA